MHMSWFFIALLAPLLWAFTNHIDKLLLEKYFGDNGVGTLMIFSSIVGIVMLPILFFINPDIFNIGLQSALILLLGGVIAASVLWLYFEALKDEEASIVVVFYQLIPVFAYLFGYIILGEVLTQLELIAMAVIILGTLVVSVEIDTENNFRLRRKTIYLMTLAAALSAFESVIFKFVAVQEDLWVSLFWDNAGLGVVGIMLFFFIAAYRKDFLKTLRTKSFPILSLNGFNEGLYVGGNVLFAYTFLLAPVALVLLVNAYQPLFVFAIGVILTLFFPKLGAESLTIRNISQKLVAIAIVGIGTYLLLLPS